MTDTGHLYDKGSRVRMHAAFTVDGNYTDPDTIVIKVKDPDDVEFQKTYGAGDIVRGSPGYYYFDHIVTIVGTWHYRFESTGPCTAAAEKTFRVKFSNFD